MCRGPAPGPLRPALVALAVLLAAAPASGQAADTTAAGDSVVPNTDPVDVRVLRAIYETDAPLFVVPVRAVNATAYDVFLAVGPVVGAGALVTGGDLDRPLRLGVTGVVNYAATRALKNLVERPRPYAALDGIDARDRGHQGDDVLDPTSFPSGHTSTAFAIATSLSLSYPRWYVVAPAAAWATTAGLARVWHGVHYPTDVVAGALVGAGSAVAVHLLVPDLLGGDDDPPVVARVVLPL